MTWCRTPNKVLIVDDDADLVSLIRYAFHTAGYETVGATSGTEALHVLQQERFSLLVLDINIPSPTGLQVCATVRRTSSIPVIILSARDEEQDLIHALDAGADAYLIKPFSPRTLIARAFALLRRAVQSPTANRPHSLFELDTAQLVLRHPQGVIQLSRLEARVLNLLMFNSGRVVSTGDLMSEVWNSYSTANRNMLKQVVFRLRRKLAEHPEALSCLKSNAGGYLWTDASRAAQPVLQLDTAVTNVAS